MNKVLLIGALMVFGLMSSLSNAVHAATITVKNEHASFRITDARISVLRSKVGGIQGNSVIVPAASASFTVAFPVQYRVSVFVATSEKESDWFYVMVAVDASELSRDGVVLLKPDGTVYFNDKQLKETC